MKKLTSLSALLLTLTLASCGGGTNGGGNTGGGNTGGGNTGGGDATIRSRLQSCPELDGSPDTAALACLAGTYTGKLVNGQPCTITMKADGSFDFVSATLTYNYVRTSKFWSTFYHDGDVDYQSIRVYMHDGYDFKMDGSYKTGQTGKLTFDFEKDSPSSVAATCTVSI